MHDRRASRGSRRQPQLRRAAPSLFQQLLALSAGRPIFRASGHITLDGDDLVVSVHDDNDDTHVLTQSDPAKRCAAPVGHADFNGQLCLTFAGVEWYASNRAASEWAFTVNGPFNLSFVGTRTATATFDRIWTTRPGSGFGTLLYYANNTTQVRFDVVRSGGAPAAINTGGGTTASPHAVIFTADQAESPQISLKRSGAAAVTTAFAGSDVTPGSTATFGADGGGGAGSRFTGRTSVLGAWLPTLDAAGTATRDAWLATYGVAA